MPAKSHKPRQPVLVPIIIPIVVAVIGALGLIIAALFSDSTGEYRGKQIAESELRPTISSLQTSVANSLVVDQEGNWPPPQIELLDFESDGPAEWKDVYAANTVRLTIERSDDQAYSGDGSIRFSIPVQTSQSSIFAVKLDPPFVADVVVAQIFWPVMQDYEIEWTDICVERTEITCEPYTIGPGRWSTVVFDLMSFGPNKEDLSNSLVSLYLHGELHSKAGIATIPVYIDAIEIYRRK